MNKEKIITFGQLLKEKDVTAYRLSVDANIPNSTAYNLRNSEIKVSSLTVKTGLRVSEALGMTLEELVKKTEGNI